MIFYLASFPRSGNTFCRQLINHYFDRISTTIYAGEDESIRFEGAEAFQPDADKRFKVYQHETEHAYRVLTDDCRSLLTAEFRRELATSSEFFFIKTHELPFDGYFEGEFVIRVVRNPGAALWSYYHYLVEIEHRAVTLEEVILGKSVWFDWSQYTETWLSTEKELANRCYKVSYETLLESEEKFITTVRDWTGLPLQQPFGTFPDFTYWHQIEPNFFRRGKTDEWKNELAPHQIILLYQQHADAMAKEGYRFDFAPPPHPVDYETRIHLAKLGTIAVENIPKVKNAGQVIEQGHLRYQVMFNGVKVPADSYSGSWHTELIRQCRGHHAPQEEYVFDYLVNHAPAGATMIELGSYWAFYAAWFLTHVNNSRAISVDPFPDNILVTLATLSLNHCNAEVEFAAVGEYVPEFERIYLGGTLTPNYILPLLNVDDIMRAHAVEHLYILHSNLQGAEVKMLEGAAEAFEHRLIDYVVISTPNNDIHQMCQMKLAAYNYHLLIEYDTFESYTSEGLIVAFSGHIQEVTGLEIHKRTAAEWTWEDAARSWADRDTPLEKHRSALRGAELAAAFERLRNERDQWLDGRKSLEAALSHAEQEVVRVQEEVKRLSETLTHRDREQALHETQTDHLIRQIEQLEQQIERVRTRKINRIMSAIGKPLV